MVRRIRDAMGSLSSDVSNPAAIAPRRVEVLAALSLAIDLGLGQPMEHMLRSAVIGLRLAHALGCDTPTRTRVFYTNLLAWIGCHADSHELAARFGDDIAFRQAYYAVDARGLPFLASLLRQTGSDLDPVPRAIARARFVAGGRSVMLTTIRSHCASAARLGDRVGLGDSLAPSLECTFERWDGHGMPDGRAGTDIPLETRIAHVADVAEVALRSGGLQAASAAVRARSGTHLDPDVVALLCERIDEIAGGLREIDPWPLALRESGDDVRLGEAELDDVLVAVGDFADLKSPMTAGHSRAVSALVERAARLAGSDEPDALRRAGWVHDLGRLGVSTGIWDKAAPLTEVERERIRTHPYLTERIVARIPGMKRVAALAGAHHERLDGSGYPRGITAGMLDAGARMLAAADAYQGSLEPRPHRPALSPAAAAQRVRDTTRSGGLDADAVAAVLAAAGNDTDSAQGEGIGRDTGSGHPVPRHQLPAGLTAREAEVLTLICQGLSDREIARALVIAPKTARNHVEHIYVKIDARNRVGATLFAIEHGLVPPR
jgi:HD-GYP domain-containing protein (c-di-GMP phosphodiesterase class II)/DNA-binding CsgD family transcriptional regulator